MRITSIVINLVRDYKAIFVLTHCAPDILTLGDQNWPLAGPSGTQTVPCLLSLVCCRLRGLDQNWELIKKHILHLALWMDQGILETQPSKFVIYIVSNNFLSFVQVLI